MIKFIFNNKNSFEDMKCLVVGQVSLPLIQEVVENIEVEGRKQGSLTKKTGNYKDITIKMTLKFIEMQEFNKYKQRIQDWLTNVTDNKLYFEDNKNKCYIVKNVNLSAITPKNGYQATFDVEFICEPFLKETNQDFIQVNKGDKIINLGYIQAEPIIKLTLPDSPTDITLNINESQFEIRQVQGKIKIDSSLFIIETENEIKTIGNLPILQLGENTINWSGTINKFEIKPNILYRG